MDDIVTYWNRGAEERYGWTKGVAVGMVVYQLLQTTDPIPR
jgi:hypothetical protein